MQNPYLDSGKRESDVTQCEWPLVTSTLMAEVMAVRNDDVTVNQPLFRLIQARKSINDAKLAISMARREWQERDPKVSEQLERIISDLDEVAFRFPMTVKG